MNSLKTTFSKAAFGTPGSDSFWLLIWILFITDNDRRRDHDRRKKRNRQTRLPRPKPPSGPRPF